MISQHELYSYVEEAFPEIREEMVTEKKQNPYMVMDALSKLTTRKAKEKNFKVVKKYFETADKLYERGNTVVKNAVENVYVYSFVKLFQACKAEKKQIMALIPLTLYTLYINQLYQHGC